MNEDKICPFMSRPKTITRANPDGEVALCTTTMEVPCKGERCMAWGNTQFYDKTGAKMETNPGCRLIP